jgi:hypothetical protein
MNIIVPTFSVRPSMRNHSAGGPEGVAGQNVWSGAVVYAGTGQSFKWVQAEWVIPDAAIPTAGANPAEYACLSWIGLGNSSLLQAGAGCVFGSNNEPSFFLWHEWTPPGWVTINNLAAGPGDLIAVVICTPSGAGSTSASVYFSNNTTGYSTSYEISFPEGSGYPASFLGDQAEWILERPVLNGVGVSQLPDYGQVFFTSANAALVSGTIVNAGTTGGNNGAIDIVINGVTLSTGTVVSQTIVQCQYSGPQPHGNESVLINA